MAKKEQTKLCWKDWAALIGLIIAVLTFAGTFLSQYFIPRSELDPKKVVQTEDISELEKEQALLKQQPNFLKL